MKHIFLLMLLAVVFWVCMACKWWAVAIITLAVMWIYFGVWMFFYLCRSWPDNSWPENA